jgi:hypothetical protein
MLALSVAGRHPVYARIDPLAVLMLVGIAAASVLVAYMRVRGYS